jgi:hypothetical protein
MINVIDLNMEKIQIKIIAQIILINRFKISKK